jgi:hypothetical protein
MRTFLIVLSGLLTIVAAIPYVVEIIRGKAKPRIVSWFTWSVLTGVACVASFVDGQVPSGILGILMLAATAETLIVVILGLKHGDRTFERLDAYCLAGAAVGLVLWLVFNSPTIAVLASVTIDLIGAIPTIKHSWEKPHEETWITFALSAAGGGITIVLADSWAATAIAYPIYLLVINVIMTSCILGSPHRKLAGEPAELRDL